MNCEYIFCIYNKDKKCIINPEINILGACNDCVNVEPDDEYLDALKIKSLKRRGEYSLLDDIK